MYENVKNGHREFHHSGTLSYSTALVLGGGGGGTSMASPCKSL